MPTPSKRSDTGWTMTYKGPAPRSRHDPTPPRAHGGPDLRRLAEGFSDTMPGRPSKYRCDAAVAVAVAGTWGPTELAKVRWGDVKRLRMPVRVWRLVCLWQLARQRVHGKIWAESEPFFRGLGRAAQRWSIAWAADRWQRRRMALTWTIGALGKCGGWPEGLGAMSFPKYVRRMRRRLPWLAELTDLARATPTSGDDALI